MIKIKFNQEMVIAWIFLSLLILGQFLSYERRMNGHLSSDKLLSLRLGFSILHSGILIFLIRAFRGPNRDWRDRSAEATKLSTWGYFWRGIVGFYTGGLILVLIQNIIPIPIPNGSYFEAALWEVPLSIASLLGIWLLFSRDRRGQAKVLVSMFRGY